MRKLLFLLTVLICTSSAKAFYYNNLYFYPTPDGCEVRGYDPNFILPVSVELNIPSYAYDEDGNQYKVTSIAKNAFKGHTEIVHLFIPATVETIGAEAFSSCINLCALALYPGTRKIENKAFFGCLSLAALNTSADIGVEAFSGCIALSAVNLGAPMKYIDAGAFMGCSILTNIDIPHTVVQLGSTSPLYLQGVFEDCLLLRSVTFAYNLSQEKPCLEKIGYNTFKNCTNLTSLEFPYSVSEIYNDAFLRCVSLKHLEWGGPKTLTVYPSDFSGSDMESIRFHGNVNMRDSKTLQAMTKLNRVQYDTYATEVQSRLYENMTSLKNVSLDKITIIKTYAFNNCTGLQSVALSTELETIEDGAFSGCISLTNIEFGQNVKSIGNCLSKSGITSLTIPDNVTSFYAPSDCANLRTVTIGDGVENCSAGSFSGCNSLESISYGKNVTRVNLKSESVRKIVCPISTPPTAQYFQNNVYQNCTLVVPVGATDAYRKARYWQDFLNITEHDMSGIDDIEADAVQISVNDGYAGIQSDSPISVYTMDGKLVRELPEGAHTLALGHGVYVIVTGTTKKKICL